VKRQIGEAVSIFCSSRRDEAQTSRAESPTDDSPGQARRSPRRPGSTFL